MGMRKVNISNFKVRQEHLQASFGEHAYAVILSAFITSSTFQTEISLLQQLKYVTYVVKHEVL